MVTLSRVVVDLSNRPHLEFRHPENTPDAQNFQFTLVEEFFRAVTCNLRACEIDPRVTGIPSTKEVL